MTTKTLTEQLQPILAHDPDIETRTLRRCEIGKAIQQGDLYLFRVADDHPHGKPWGSRQVALGTTLGARHVAAGDLDVFAGVPGATAKIQPLFSDAQRAACLGPVVVAKEGWTLEHPEHPHHCLPAGTYQVVHQWDEQIMGRVED